MNAKVTDPAATVNAEAGEPAGELESLLQAPVSHAAAQEPQVIEADVDGRRVKIVARDQIVLECGEASITLHRNGRIVIKGTYVETASEGTNRIKGGQVRIN
jgi:uncharacterized protein (DUF2345 family)